MCMVWRTISGEALEKAGSYLSAALLAGYLRSSRAAEEPGVSLNLINAPVLAKEAGLQVSSLTDCHLGSWDYSKI